MQKIIIISVALGFCPASAYSLKKTPNVSKPHLLSNQSITTYMSKHLQGKCFCKQSERGQGVNERWNGMIHLATQEAWVHPSPALQAVNYLSE